MALNLSSFSILFALVLMIFTQVLARELVTDRGLVKEEKWARYSLRAPDPNTVYLYSVPPSPPPADDCNPETEKKAAVGSADQFNGDKQEGHGVGAGHGGYGGGRS